MDSSGHIKNSISCTNFVDMDTFEAFNKTQAQDLLYREETTNHISIEEEI